MTTNRVRISAAFVIAAGIVPTLALAQDMMHPHGSPTLPVQSAQRGDIQYGAQPIPLPSMQKAGPPSPSGGGVGGPSVGGGPTVSQPGGPPKPGGGAGPTPGGPTPGGPSVAQPPKPTGPAQPGGGPPKPGAPQEQPAPVAGDGSGCEPHSPLPAGLPAVAGGSSAAYQQFPPSGPMRTAWFVTFDHAVHRGLFITTAYFKPSPTANWIKVLSEAGPSEIFVPYQSGQPRYLDLALPSEGGAGEFGLMPSTQRDAGRCGRITGRGNAVVREVTEKGLLWKLNQLVYRGHKMTLWGTLGSGNYNYVLSYGFNDDGTIEFRGGATATNLPQKPREAHIHNIIWRVNVDLNGAQNNVSVMRHLENTNAPTWRDIMEPFNNNREGSLEWNPREFTTLHIASNTLKNANGAASGYMIMPLYRGTARHQESWMRKDIWVTRYKPQEIGYQFIERYANNEAIDNSDVVIWLTSSILHTFREEDGKIYRRPNQPARFIGAAVIMWGGFDMKPHNIFDNTPFFPEFK